MVADRDNSHQPEVTLVIPWTRVHVRKAGIPESCLPLMVVLLKNISNHGQKI